MVHNSIRTLVTHYSSNDKPDLSCLAAFPYVKCSAFDALTQTSITLANAYVTKPTTVTPPAVCNDARDLLKPAILSSVSLSDINPASVSNAISNIKTAFFNGPRDVASRIIRVRLNYERGNFTSSDDVVISGWFDRAKALLIKTDLPMLFNTPDVNDTVNYNAWSALSTDFNSWMSFIAENTTDYLLIGNADVGDSNSVHTNEVINTVTSSISRGTILETVKFVFKPWLLLTYIEMFAKNKAFNIHTQAMAYKLFVDVSARALDMIAKTYTPPDVELTNIANKMVTLIPIELSDVDHQLLKVVQKSSNNRKKTIELQAVNATAGLRLQRSNDMQIRFQVLESRVIHQKQLMMMWIVALLAVLGTSTFLVVTDHLMPFMLLVFGTMAVLLIVVAVPFLYNYMKRKTNSI